MCLIAITKRFDPPDPTVREAYKILCVGTIPDGDHNPQRFLMPLCMSDVDYLNNNHEWVRAIHQHEPSRQTLLLYRYRDRWDTSVQKPTLDQDWNYPVGFHCYPDLATALASTWMGPHWESRRHRTVIKVEVRGVHTEGWDGSDGVGSQDQLVIVANELRFIEEVQL